MSKRGLDVRRRDAGSVGHSAESHVQTSGGCVLDLHQPLLKQAESRELTYVAREVGASCSARSIMRALAGTGLDDDTDAMVAVVSLAFGDFFNQSLEGGSTSQQPTDLDLGP